MDCPCGQASGEGTAAAAGDDHSHEEFATIYDCWLAEQERDLPALRSAVACCAGGADYEARLRPLIERVLSHYERYYCAKAASSRRNLLPMFTPTWTSSTENLFLWAGGWRPTVAIHLLYSKSGLQLVSQLDNLLESRSTADLAGLTLVQINRVDLLHRRTVQLEKEISEQEAQVQETVADAEMVELSHAMAEGDHEGWGEAGGEMDRAMERKRERMNEVLKRADELRLETLKAVVETLNPLQAAHFLIAAAELLLKVHEFGKSKDTATADAATGSKKGVVSFCIADEIRLFLVEELPDAGPSLNRDRLGVVEEADRLIGLPEMQEFGHRWARTRRRFSRRPLIQHELFPARKK